MHALRHDPGGHHRARPGTSRPRGAVTLAAGLTLLAGVTTVLAPAASAGSSGPSDIGGFVLYQPGTATTVCDADTVSGLHVTIPWNAAGWSGSDYDASVTVSIGTPRESESGQFDWTTPDESQPIDVTAGGSGTFERTFATGTVAVNSEARVQVQLADPDSPYNVYQLQFDIPTGCETPINVPDISANVTASLVQCDNSHSITIENTSDSTTLSGTLYWAQGGAFYPLSAEWPDGIAPGETKTLNEGADDDFLSDYTPPAVVAHLTAKNTDQSVTIGIDYAAPELVKNSDCPTDGDGDTGNSGNTGNAGNTGNTGTPTTPTAPVKSEPVISSVTAGGTASSASATKPSATTPVIASVTSPVAGNVSFTAVSGPVAPPKVDAGAYTMLGRSFIIEAPAATPNKPLSLDFTIDNSIMPTGPAGADAIVFRDGVAVPNCTAPNATIAAPDPCVARTSTNTATTSIRVLSSHASTWTFGVAKADRVAGSNRYATAAALATQFGTANAIVVANGTDAKDGADALAANYLAGTVKAPIVLAQASRVDTETLTAVKAILKGAANPTIYVMGGADSISNAIADQIKSAAASVTTGTVAVKRVGGADRYATAALAATTPGAVTNSLKLSASGKAATTAILASGEVNADALAAGALSNAWGIPVLLTQAGQLPKPVKDAITAQKITQLIVLGGTDRVSQAVLDQATAAGVTSTKRIAGSNRFDTSAQLYTFAMGTLTDSSGEHYGADGTTVYLANGVTGFPDALAVGPLAGKSGSALLTVRPNALGGPATAFLKAHADTIDSVTGLGSASTISAAVLAQAEGLV